MCRAPHNLCRHHTRIHPYVSFSRRMLSTAPCIISNLGQLNVEEFRKRAFDPEQPLAITTANVPTVDIAIASSIPATTRWFDVQLNGTRVLNFTYLERFRNITLPYELVSVSEERSKTSDRHVAPSHGPVYEPSFQRFDGPLDLFLAAARSSHPPRLYIAQAQLQDLPPQLRDDLPIPPIVLTAGKGDIYDANIWMGIPPTYTPLHKDPNPNLFVQLASSKVVRLFSPVVGRAIFQNVQEKIGMQASAAFRGDEMMQGPERKALEEAVWNCPGETFGFEVVVRPGDALFIPQGWWHSIKSIGGDITASVNWWFR